jgi:hypothetical protein
MGLHQKAKLRNCESEFIKNMKLHNEGYMA